MSMSYESSLKHYNKIQACFTRYMEYKIVFGQGDLRTILQEALAAGYDINFTPEYNAETVLDLALNDGSKEYADIKFLLDNGFNVNPIGAPSYLLQVLKRELNIEEKLKLTMMLLGHTKNVNMRHPHGGQTAFSLLCLDYIKMGAILGKYHA